MTKRLIAVGNYFGAHQPFADMFSQIIVIPVGPDLDRVNHIRLTADDTVLFGGGADITPMFYNQKAIRRTGAGDFPSTRDAFEKAMFERAKSVGAKMLGICRGAQLICALSGGSLVQDVSKHSGPDHRMVTKDGQEITVCSVHHQMMNPFGVKHELIGWAKEALSDHYTVEGEVNIEMPVEPEIVYFPEVKGLGIQYHPEFMNEGDPAVLYARHLVKDLLLS